MSLLSKNLYQVMEAHPNTMRAEELAIEDCPITASKDNISAT